MMRDQKLWTWHVVAGCVIAVLLGLHMLTMHMDEVVPIRALNPAGGEPIDWENVVARGKAVLTPVVYIALLGAALFHGLYGLRNILLELNPPAGARKAISWLVVVGGVGLFALGTWAAVAAHMLAVGRG